MKNNKSPKVLWNVFLFVICGGSLIYGFVQQRKAVESRVEMKKYMEQADSLKTEINKIKNSSNQDSIQ
jgi:hypothetical protein